MRLKYELLCSQHPTISPFNDSNGYRDNVIEHFTLPGHNAVPLGS